MKLRPHIAPPSWFPPLPSRSSLPIACAMVLLATSACESGGRRDTAPPPRSVTVPASESRSAGVAPTTGPATTPLTDAPNTEVVPPATAGRGPVCPAGFTCDYAAWQSEPRPKIDEIFVQKGPHRLHLVSGKTVVRSYSVALGWGGMGPKKYEGDGVTPVGTYKITDRLDSKWHTFLGVSYPSLEDQLEFPRRRARGEVPPGVGIGFGIALHGRAKSQQDGEHKKSDWTLGCIALDNPEIDEVASVVKRGTRIVITD